LALPFDAVDNVDADSASAVSTHVNPAAEGDITHQKVCATKYSKTFWVSHANGTGVPSAMASCAILCLTCVHAQSIAGATCGLHQHNNNMPVMIMLVRALAGVYMCDAINVNLLKRGRRMIWNPHNFHVLKCMQGLVFAAPRVNETNMSRDHSHGNIHVHNRPDDSAHASAQPAADLAPDDGTMV